MPPLMLALQVGTVIVVGYFAYAAFTMAHAASVARRKAQRVIDDSTLGRMNPHAMQRFLNDLANPYGIPDEQSSARPEPDILIKPVANHQTYFGVQGDDARLAAVVIAHSTGPSEGYNA